MGSGVGGEGVGWLGGERGGWGRRRTQASLAATRARPTPARRHAAATATFPMHARTGAGRRCSPSPPPRLEALTHPMASQLPDNHMSLRCLCMHPSLASFGVQCLCVCVSVLPLCAHVAS